MTQLQHHHSPSSTFCQPWHNCGQWVFIWRLFCNTIPCSLLWHGWSQPLHLLLLLLLHLLLLRSLVSDPSLAVLSSRDLTLDFMWASCPSPWTQVDGIVAATRELAASGAIDPVEEMSEDQVEILSSFCNCSGFHFPRTQGPDCPLDKCCSHTPVLLRVCPGTQYWRKEWLTGHPWHGEIFKRNSHQCSSWYSPPSSPLTIMAVPVTRCAPTSTSTTATTTELQPFSKRSSLF